MHRPLDVSGWFWVSPGGRFLCPFFTSHFLPFPKSFGLQSFLLHTCELRSFMQLVFLYAKIISFVHKLEQGSSLYSTSSDHSSSCKMKRIKASWAFVLLAALEVLLMPAVRITIYLSRYTVCINIFPLGSRPQYWAAAELRPTRAAAAATSKTWVAR